MSVNSNVSPQTTKVDASTHIDSHNVTNVTLNLDMGQMGRMDNYFDNTLPGIQGCQGGMSGMGANRALGKLAHMVIPLLQMLKSLLSPMGQVGGMGGLGGLASYQSPYSHMSGSPRLGYGSVY